MFKKALILIGVVFSLAAIGQTVNPGVPWNVILSQNNTWTGTQTFNALVTFLTTPIIPFVQNGTGAVSRTVDSRLKDEVDVKDFALGNTLWYSDGAISATTSVFTSNAATFSANDIGKYILVHGSGAAGIAQQGTITGFTNSHQVTVSFTAATTVSGAKYIYGSDDTAGVTNAINYATSSGSCLKFQSGGYWLATQNTAITLNYTCIRGVGSVEFQSPYVGSGSTIIVTATSVPVFTVGAGVDMQGMMFYWPAQDASAATPITYPPLLDGSAWSNDTFVNNVFINPYELARVDVNGALGRVSWTNNRAYCVKYCYNMLAGNPDNLELIGNTYSTGIYQDYALYTNGGVLGGWTGDNGEFIHMDATGSTNTSFTVNMTGGLVYGYRYGIRIVNLGSMQVSTLNGVAWDGVSTVLSFEGGTFPATVHMIGGYVWSYRGTASDANSAADYVINFSGSCTGGNIGIGTIDFEGVDFANSKGGILNFQTNCLRSAGVHSNAFRAWGQSTTHTTYYGLVYQGPPLDVASNRFDSNPVSGSTMQCILSYGGGNISGNAFNGCNNAITWLGSTAVNITGNYSYNSTAVPITGSGTLLQENGNFWDVALTIPTATTCGTTPIVAAGSTDTRGAVTTGTGAPTSCTVNFAYTKPKAPFCVLTAENNSAYINPGVPPTTSVLTVYFTAGCSTCAFIYNCTP